MNEGDALFQISHRFGLEGNPGLTVVAAIRTGIATASVGRVWHIGDETAGCLSGTLGTGGVSWNYNDGGIHFSSISDGTNTVVAWRRSADGTCDDGEVFVNGIKQVPGSVENPSMLPSNSAEMFQLFGGPEGEDPFYGEISAIAVFDELSDADLNSVMSIFASKFTAES